MLAGNWPAGIGIFLSDLFREFVAEQQVEMQCDAPSAYCSLKHHRFVGFVRRPVSQSIITGWRSALVRNILDFVLVVISLLEFVVSLTTGKDTNGTVTYLTPGLFARVSNIGIKLAIVQIVSNCTFDEFWGSWWHIWSGFLGIFHTVCHSLDSPFWDARNTAVLLLDLTPQWLGPKSITKRSSNERAPATKAGFISGCLYHLFVSLCAGKDILYIIYIWYLPTSIN